MGGGVGLCPTEKGDSPQDGQNPCEARCLQDQLLERTTWNKSPKSHPRAPQLAGMEPGPTSEEARSSEASEACEQSSFCEGDSRKSSFSGRESALFWTGQL